MYLFLSMKGHYNIKLQKVRTDVGNSVVLHHRRPNLMQGSVVTSSCKTMACKLASFRVTPSYIGTELQLPCLASLLLFSIKRSMTVIPLPPSQF